MTETIETANPDRGFFGGIAHVAEPARAWRIALAAVAEATGCDEAAVREFLDSRHGRHFADDAVNELGAGRSLAGAIEAAVQRWMGWRIDRRTARETGIPAGLPYLTGFVAHHGILAEAAD
jgi:hypothetical protein